MSYRADKQVIDTHTHTHTDRHTDMGDDNTRRPKLASGKNDCELVFSRVSMANGHSPLYIGAYYRSQIDKTANISLDGLSSALSQLGYRPCR